MQRPNRTAFGLTNMRNWEVYVTNSDKPFFEASLKQYLDASVSRSQLFKAAAMGLVAASVPGLAAAQSGAGGSNPGAIPGSTFSEPYFPQIKSGTYSPESLATIFNTAVTAEYLAVTVLTAALNSTTLNLASNPTIQAAVQAALTEELAHLTFLRDGVGAKPATTTFTVPDPAILTDQKTFFHTLEVAENLFVAAYMTATREFAEVGQPTLAKIAYQIGATEAEHRAVVRTALVLLGDSSGSPPNNKAFETDLLLYVGDAATILTQLGFIGGTGTPASYPGDQAAITAAGPEYSAVIQKTPNNAASTVTVTGAGDLTGERASG
jgi:hypothetical protein